MHRTALLACLTAALPSCAAWQEVHCPEVPPPAADLYQPVRTLADFEAGDDGLQVLKGQQQAPGTAKVEPGAGRDGQAALRVNYDFAGGKAIEYLELGTPFTLDEKVTGFGLWIKQTGGPLHLKLRFKDPSGETHQIPMFMTEGEGWQFAAARMDAVPGHWGGDEDGKLQYPAQVYSVVADRPSREFDGSGTIWLDDFTILKERPRAKGLTIDVDGPALGLLYAPGDTLKVRISGGTSVRWAWMDEGGTVRERGTSREPTLAMDQPGYYALQVSMLNGDVVAAEQILSCAALAPTDGRRNDFVGLGCHFRNGGYPLECQDLLVKLGITHFRDEISWSTVEREAGLYALPEQGLKYVDAAVAKGLEPLLILDYGNPNYEDGGFPTEKSSVQAYAKYAAEMAKRLAGKIHAFEIWNEWSGGCGMTGKPRTNTPEAYGAMLKAAYASLKAVDPNLTVVGIGGDHSAHHFDKILGMVKAAGPGSMDAWSVHSYRYPRTPEESDLVGEIQTIAAANAELGLRKPIWLTEIGWPTQLDNRGVDEFTQAQYIVRTMALLQSTKLVDRVYWYDFKDDGLKRDYNENNFGIIHHQTYALMPKPAAISLSVFARMTAGAKVVGLETKGDGRCVRYRTAAGQDLLVAWSASDDLPAKVTGQGVSRSDLMGATLDGPVVLTGAAQYFVGAGLALEW